MLRVALVLRSTDVRPDFLVLHVLLVHIVEYMSFVGNITPGPYWWWVYANRALHCRSRYAFNANSGCQTATHVKTCSCVVRPQHTWRSSGDNICYASRRRMTRPAQCSSRRDNNNSCESRRCIIRSGHIVYVAPQHMVIIAPLYHHCSTKLRRGTPTFVKNSAIVS